MTAKPRYLPGLSFCGDDQIAIFHPYLFFELGFFNEKIPISGDCYNLPFYSYLWIAIKS